jgi:hypothetical protein
MRLAVTVVPEEILALVYQLLVQEQFTKELMVAVAVVVQARLVMVVAAVVVA